MDARTALTQIGELIDDVQAEFPDVAMKIRDAVGEARNQEKPEAEMPKEESETEEKPKDFRNARKAAMADNNLFGRKEASDSDEGDEPEEEDEEKKKRDRVKAF